MTAAGGTVALTVDWDVLCNFVVAVCGCAKVTNSNLLIQNAASANVRAGAQYVAVSLQYFAQKSGSKSIT